MLKPILTLEEMKLLTEQPAYDFKLELPELPDNAKIGQEACAFANLAGGGVLLVGIDNDGNVRGIERRKLDGSMLRIVGIIEKGCNPVPRFEFKVFSMPDDPARCVLVLRVYELEVKPCMFDDKVYRRLGSSLHPATPDEIRRLILR